MPKTVRFAEGEAAAPRAPAVSFPRGCLKRGPEPVLGTAPESAAGTAAAVYNCEMALDGADVPPLLAYLVEQCDNRTIKYAVLHRLLETHARSLTPALAARLRADICAGVGAVAACDLADGRAVKEVSMMLLVAQSVLLAEAEPAKFAVLAEAVIDVMRSRSKSVELVKTCICVVNACIDCKIATPEHVLDALRYATTNNMRANGYQGLLKRIEASFPTLLAENPDVWAVLALRMLLADEFSRQTAVQLLGKHETRVGEALQSALQQPYRQMPQYAYRDMVALVLKKQCTEPGFSLALRLFQVLLKADVESGWLWFIDYFVDALPERIPELWNVVVEHGRFESVQTFLLKCSEIEISDTLCVQFIAEAEKCTSLDSAYELMETTFVLLDSRAAAESTIARTMTAMASRFVALGLEIKQSRFPQLLEAVVKFLVSSVDLDPCVQPVLGKLVEFAAENDNSRALLKPYDHLLGSSRLERKHAVLLSSIADSDPKALMHCIPVMFRRLKGPDRLVHIERLFEASPQWRSNFLEEYIRVFCALKTPTVDEWTTAFALLRRSKKPEHISRYSLVLLQQFDHGTESEEAWTLWVDCFNMSSSGREAYLSAVGPVSYTGLRSLVTLDGLERQKVRILCNAVSELPLPSVKLLATNSGLVDRCIRELLRRKDVKSINLALQLVPPGRMHVVVRELLNFFHEAPRNAASHEVVNLWNRKVAPQVLDLQPFVSTDTQNEMRAKFPQLRIPHSLISKAPALTTPPQKRRKLILTGTLPETTLTPPQSQDSERGSDYSVEIPSSPPVYVADAHDQTKSLKRTMLSLDIQDSTRNMTRAEKMMIYNIMFRSCVWLKSNLAETAEPVTDEDIDNAKIKLEESVSRLPLSIRQDLMRPIDGMSLDDIECE